MSFSSEVKAELAKHLGKSMHCRIAELAALIAFAGNIQEIQSENPLLQEKYRLLIKQLFGLEEAESAAAQKRIFSSVKMWEEETGRAALTDTVNGILMQQTCCRRAFIRGAFLAGDRKSVV